MIRPIAGPGAPGCIAQLRDQQRAASTSAVGSAELNTSNAEAGSTQQDAALASNPALAAKGTEGAEDDRRKEKVMSCLTCTLCDELYREATTITECMHSFCKVCIDSKLRFKSSTNKCPVCGIPLSGDPYGVGQLKYDGVLDDIVTKLFPRDGDAERAIVRDKRLAEERAFLKAKEDAKKPKKYTKRKKPDDWPEAQAARDPSTKVAVAALPKMEAAPDPPPFVPAVAVPMLAAMGRKRLEPSSVKNEATPAQVPPAAASASPKKRDDVLKIKIDRRTGSSFPTLAKSYFRVYPNVRMGTLANHVLKKLRKQNVEVPDGVVMRLYMHPVQAALASGEMIKGALPEDLTVEEIIQRLGANLPYAGDAQGKFTLEFLEERGAR